MYRKLRNFVNRVEKKLECTYHFNLIEETQGDGKRMWDVLKIALSNKSTTEPTSISSKEKNFNKPMGIATTLNTLFATMGKK